MRTGYVELDATIKEIRSWQREVKTGPYIQQAQQEADILATAGILLAALRTLDNTFREIMRAVRRFDHNSIPPKRRTKVTEQIIRFADQERILPIIRQSLEQLRGMGSQLTLNQTKRRQLDSLITSAEGILAILCSDVTPFPSPPILHAFLNQIDAANTDEQDWRIREQAEEFLRMLDHKYLAEADIAFGQLMAAIGAEYSKLGYPGWAVAL